MQSIVLPGASNFRFSAVRPDVLGATEYTLVTIVLDTSTSVNDFAGELLACVKAIIDACRKSPRADNLLVRLVSFNTKLKEVFGFKALVDIDSNNVDSFSPQGMTALYDASFEAIGATEQYAKLLYDQEFDTNAAVYVITDGEDNQSKASKPAKIADMLNRVRQQEQLESIVTVLIGINTKELGIQKALNEYANDAKFDQYIDAGDATSANLARLAGFVSRSISSQSQALGTGGPSQSLSF
jgi:hypothetical protein